VFTRILAACVGNVCRSPMAEAVLRARLSDRGVAVESAGIAALVGSPADPLAREVAASRGLDLSAHRARQLTAEVARGFELVLVMSTGQQREVEKLVPAMRGRVQRIGRWGGFDVPDPFRQGRAAFEHALALIERGADDLVRAFWRGKP
jgi:protein-tyrosine phosphatase